MAILADVEETRTRLISVADQLAVRFANSWEFSPKRR